MGANALRMADVILGALGTCSTVDSLAVGVASCGVSIFALAVGVAALEVSVEVSLAYLLGTASFAIWPESSFAWASIVLALALALASWLLGSSIITEGNYEERKEGSQDT